MRLINANNFELETFNDHRSTPKYAILSHTWEDDEVLFQDIQNLSVTCKNKKGFKKIEYTCSQALDDGLKYAWVDTCCIDKTSSAELSEAINSMFAWYRESEVCYVYLTDVDDPEEVSDNSNASADRDDSDSSGHRREPPLSSTMDSCKEQDASRKASQEDNPLVSGCYEREMRNTSQPEPMEGQSNDVKTPATVNEPGKVPSETHSPHVEQELSLSQGLDSVKAQDWAYQSSQHGVFPALARDGLETPNAFRSSLVEGQEDDNTLSVTAHKRDEGAFETQFASSRWFTRGWTLQELIAPRNISFFSRTWIDLGTLDSLASAITTITNIPLALLYGKTEVSGYCVARRMSWASRRNTTRIEDEAYCLLGIFGINMPLLYGERQSAFQRLQQEILRTSTDLSILAWESESISEENESNAGTVDGPVSGLSKRGTLLAGCPARFALSGHISRDMTTLGFKPVLSMTPKAIQGSFQMSSLRHLNERQALVALGCYDDRFPCHGLTLRVSSVRAIDQLEEDDEYIWERRNDRSMPFQPCCPFRLYLISRFSRLKSIDASLLHGQKSGSSRTLQEQAQLRNLSIVKYTSELRHRLSVTDVYPKHGWNTHGMNLQSTEGCEDEDRSVGFTLSIEQATASHCSAPSQSWTIEVELTGNDDCPFAVRCMTGHGNDAKEHRFTQDSDENICIACSTNDRANVACNYFRSWDGGHWPSKLPFVSFTGLEGGESLTIGCLDLFELSIIVSLTGPSSARSGLRNTRSIHKRYGPNATNHMYIAALLIARAIASIKGRIKPMMPSLRRDAYRGFFVDEVRLSAAGPGAISVAEHERFLRGLESEAGRITRQLLRYVAKGYDDLD